MGLGIKSEVEAIASSLGTGMTRRMVCPSCGGGTSQEDSFVVGREVDRVWYKCFRDSCSSSPGIIGGHKLAPAERKTELDKIKPYWGHVLGITARDVNYFLSRFGIHYETMAEHIHTTENDEYILPFRGPTGRLRGYVVRQPVWSGEPCWRSGRGGDIPKTINYRHSLEPVLAWYRPDRSFDLKNSTYEFPCLERRQVILVEDQISAMRIMQDTDTDAVALLGTGLNAERVMDIAREAYSVVTICLDPDAQGTAQQLRRKWGGYWNRTRIVALPCDPKDYVGDLSEELRLV